MKAITQPVFSDGIGLTIVAMILIAAIPYVARIRHPRQKPLAAYLIFIFMFIITVSVLFTILLWLVSLFDLSAALSKPWPSVLFLALIFLPAIALGTWQARKPPQAANKRPPD